jgi:hypothetical protein
MQNRSAMLRGRFSVPELLLIVIVVVVVVVVLELALMLPETVWVCAPSELLVMLVVAPAS